MGLEAVRNILDRLDKQHIMANSPRWVNIIWVVALLPGTILLVIFGSLAMGSAGHFRTPHGILGLFTIILALAAAVLHHMVMKPGSAGLYSKTSQVPITRRVANQVLLGLAMIASLTGFVDLSTISLCLTHMVSMEIGIIAGFALASVWTLGQAANGLDLWLGWKDGKKIRVSYVTKKEVPQSAGEDQAQWP